MAADICTCAGAPIEHVGMCVRVQGHKVGTLCVLYPRAAWGPGSQAALEDAASKVAQRLEAAARRLTAHG